MQKNEKTIPNIMDVSESGIDVLRDSHRIQIRKRQKMSCSLQ